MVGVSRRRIAFGAIATLIGSALAMVSPGTAYAATYSFRVTGEGDGEGHCDPGTHRCTTLRAAVNFANSLGGVNTVSVMLPARTYSLHLGELALAGPGLTFDLIGAGAGRTIIERVPTAEPARILDTCVPSGAPPPSEPCLAGPTVRLSRIAIRNGRLIDGSGAGIRNGRGSMSLTGVIVQGNAISITNGTPDARHGFAGGGIFNNGALAVTNSTISGNSATMTGTEFGVVFGAGISSRDGSLTVDRSTVSDNIQTACENGDVCGGGGAAINARGGFLTITNSTVSGNVATNQGVAGVLSFAGNVASITNSTISGNAASRPGTLGGFSRLGRGRTTFTNVTISGNSAPDGGGITNFGAPDQVLVRNSILANNTGGNCGGAVTSGGYNLDSGDSCQFRGNGDLTNKDPKLGPLQDNGGPTQTQALRPESPAIDAVGEQACPPPATDQRGVTRPQGPRCDMGAFEVDEPESVFQDRPGPAVAMA